MGLGLALLVELLCPNDVSAACNLPAGYFPRVDYFQVLEAEFSPARSDVIYTSVSDSNPGYLSPRQNNNNISKLNLRVGGANLDNLGWRVETYSHVGITCPTGWVYPLSPFATPAEGGFSINSAFSYLGRASTYLDYSGTSPQFFIKLFCEDDAPTYSKEYDEDYICSDDDSDPNADDEVIEMDVINVDFVRLWDDNQEANRTTRAIDPVLRLSKTYEDNERAISHDMDPDEPMLLLGGWCNNMTAADVNLQCQFEPASAGEHVLWRVDANVGSVDGDSTGNFASGDTVPLRFLPATATMAVHEDKDFVVKLGIDQNGDSLLSDAEAFPIEWGIRVIGKPEYDYCRAGLPSWQVSLGWLVYPDACDLIDIFLDTDLIPSYEANDLDTIAFGGSYDMKNGLGCDATSLTQGNLRKYTWQKPSGFRKRVLLSDDMWIKVIEPTLLAMDIGGWYANPANTGNYKAFVGQFQDVVYFNDENLSRTIGKASVDVMVIVHTERATPKPKITHMELTGAVTDLYDFRTYGSDEPNGYASRIQVCYAPSCGRTAGNIFKVLVDCDVTQFTLITPVEYDNFTDLNGDWIYKIISGW